MFEKSKEAHAAKLREQALHAAEADQAALSAIANRAYEAWNMARLENSDATVPGVALKKGEVSYLTLNHVGLVEPRHAPGHWAGGSQGFSFHVVKGVNYRVGQTRGTYTQGEERPEITDEGLGVITNQRILFVGTKRSMEWSYAKMLGFNLEADAMAIFSVSNRQKASGFAYQAEADHIIDAVITAAIAKFRSPDDHAAVVAELLTMYNEAYQQWQAADTITQITQTSTDATMTQAT